MPDLAIRDQQLGKRYSLGGCTTAAGQDADSLTYNVAVSASTRALMVRRHEIE